jgi:hypothetical protein
VQREGQVRKQKGREQAKGTYELSKERGRDKSQHQKKVSIQEVAKITKTIASFASRQLKASRVQVVQTFDVDRIGLASTKEDSHFHLSWLRQSVWRL